MDEEKLDRTKRDKEQQDNDKRDKEQQDNDKVDEENYLKTIQWPKSDDEWIKYDFKKMKSGTLMPFKEPPRHQIEPEVPRNPDGTIIIVDEKQKNIDRLTRQLEALPEGKQLLQVEDQQKTIDALISHVTALTNKVNDLTSASMAVPDASSN